jgi:glutamyl-tRNA synthetase
MLSEFWPEMLEREKEIEEKKELPPLKSVHRFNEIRTRFAPNPDGPLHLGSAEPIIFCDEYAKMYNGTFILRYEDTSPDVKAPIQEIYKLIEEDLEWLGVLIDEIYFQSDRLEIYYNYAEKLIEIGAAYVCVCRSADFKIMYKAKNACPCRALTSEVHLQRWRMMLDGGYNKGEAVVRIKTDLNHPNPALREFPALRISRSSHPRTGRKYRVWPLYNFSCAIDDHEMKISHIIRGKEHEVNTLRQKYIYKHLGWEYPEVINIGRLGIEAGVLSKSKIIEGVENGLFTGWDDPRLGTLRALKRRGFQPEAIRELMIQIGPKPINATVSWPHIASINRRIIEPKVNRYFFVKDPITMSITDLNETYTSKLPLHPDFPERGYREHIITPKTGKIALIVSKDDVDNLLIGGVVRLMGLFNVIITEKDSTCIMAELHSLRTQEARNSDAVFIHWLTDGVGEKGVVVMTDASEAKGLVERSCTKLKPNNVIQFERFGFVRVDCVLPFVGYYSHK